MTYRDDHDAALRRADALAREVDELRRKNQALETERAEAEAERARQAAARAAADEPRRELEALARAKRPARTRRDRPVKPAPSAAEKLVSRALSDVRWMGVAMVALAIAAMLGYLWILSSRSPLTKLVAFALGGSVYFASLWLASRRAEAGARRWLAALPFELPDYLDYLGHEHAADTIITVTVELDVPDRDRRTVADAVVGAMPKSRAAFEGDRLVVRSPAIWARFRLSKAGERTEPHNHLLHRWVRRLIQRALLPIARAYPIRRVTVS